MKKSVVIIGGSGEIGNIIAKNLSHDYQIIIIHKTSLSCSDNCTKQEYYDFCGDMTDPEQIKLAVDKIISKFGAIDILINCIGKNIPVKLENIDLQLWKDVIETNLQSVFFLCQIIGAEMLKQETGVIINFASTAGINPLPKSPHYIAAKAGVIALTKYFAQVYAPNIRVNAIAPGYILTKNHKPEYNINYNSTLEKIPLGRMANIEEIIDIVYYIINSKYVTGQILVVDGGMTL
jgi:3-oxoacyl-[acyl-carrier protein] reductase